jgi:hypothetical protein
VCGQPNWRDSVVHPAWNTAQPGDHRLYRVDAWVRIR